MSRLNDPENFSGRVNYACQVIARNGTATRSFDNCFENYDGDEVAVAVLRRSQNNPAIAKNIDKFLKIDQAAIDRLKDVPTRKLAAEARKSREKARIEHDRWLAENDRKIDETANAPP